jgi:predicted RNA binding protein YcfA (HicA-like mRNA interferase family)
LSRATKTLQRVLSGGSDANLSFADLCGLLSWLGFTERIVGSHHIFVHESVAEILNLQPKKGKAKPYQVKQVRSLILTHGLAGTDIEDDHEE